MFDGAVKTLAIVDDIPENRFAAEKAVSELYPEVQVRLYASAAEFVSALADDRSFDFVISDMCMETSRAGYDVACAAWSWNIPCVIVSGGVDHGQSVVHVGYPSATYKGDKSDPDLWKRVIQGIQDGGAEDNGHRAALRIGKHTEPDKVYGRACAGIAVP